MKKLVLGCLGVFLLVMVAVGALGYVYIIRPAATYVAGLARIAEIGDLDQQVQNRSAFQPPASGELSAAAVQRFVTVQETIHSRLGATFETLREKYERLERQLEAEGRQLRLGEALGAYTDLVGIIVEAKRAQVDALNAAGFSLAEYDWVRRQVYTAAGLQYIELSHWELLQAVEGQDTVAALDVTRPDDGAPARNRDLVQPYEERLREWIALAWFGL